MLEQTASVCDQAMQKNLLSLCHSDPLEKPSGHKGGTEVDMFNTNIALQDVKNIVQQVAQACATGAMTEGIVVRDYSGILKAWEEYERWYATSTIST